MASRKFDLSGRVSIVTGASRGIGRAIALGLAEAGSDVVASSRSLPALEEVAASVRSMGRRSLAIAADVTSQEDVQRLVDATLREFGKIDVLVNNAGVSPVLARAEEMTRAQWEEVIGTNLTGCFLCAQAVGRAMIQQKRGKIINVTSILAEVANPRLSAYSASKAGVLALTRALAVEWARHNIQVNALAPGWVDTEMTRPMMGSKAIYDNLLGKIPMGRFATPEEMVGAAVFLASDESSYMTGQAIYLDGGCLAL